MGLAELHPLTGYRRGQHDIAKDFYLPCMARATSYDRAVGFFSSSIYVIAWSSLKDFVRRGGHMRIVCSPVLSHDDMAALDEGYDARDEEENMDRLRADIARMLDDPYLHKPTRVLAALVAMGVIDFQIAVLGKNGDSGAYRRIFHDKVGIFKDEAGGVVVFKGSMNETWAGLSEDGNLESIDVYVSGGGVRDEQRVEGEVDFFEALWDDRYPGVSVRTFPDVARDELVNAADTTQWAALVDEICTEMDLLSALSVKLKLGERTPRPHQTAALQDWFDRDRRGIFEHATGSGKTFTALCAIKDALDRGEIPIILVPSDLLLKQWHDEILAAFGDALPRILRCGGGHGQWRHDDLLSRWTRRGGGAPRLVLATMQTASTDAFLRAVRQGEHLFMVADEVHRLGSPAHLKILSLDTGPRLGLSATPRRAGDPDGTDEIFAYFGGVVPPPFTLDDAIRAQALTPYMYYVHTVGLTDDEQGAWDRATEKIQRLYAQNVAAPDGGDATVAERIRRLLIERARIVKGAEKKVGLARDVLARYYRAGQRWIVYCDTQDQLRDVLSALRRDGLNAMEYHSEMRGDREQTLRHFEANGGILVSIRCLDEGVDIPAVGHALILASSKNPREFIQRRGRVLRKAPGKPLAYIHDAVVVPTRLDEDAPGTAIVQGELARAVEFGKSAQNPSAITDLQLIAVRAGLDPDELIGEGFEDDD